MLNIYQKKKKKKERKKERKRKQNSNDFVVSWINNKDLWEFQKYCLYVNYKCMLNENT